MRQLTESQWKAMENSEAFTPGKLRFSFTPGKLFDMLAQEGFHKILVFGNLLVALNLVVCSTSFLDVHCCPFFWRIYLGKRACVKAIYIHIRMISNTERTLKYHFGSGERTGPLLPKSNSAKHMGTNCHPEISIIHFHDGIFNAQFAVHTVPK